MRSALLALALTAASAALAADDEALPPDVACKEDKATCKEDCSLDYGMSEATRTKVPKCLADCEQAEVICLARHVAKRRAGQAKEERERYAAPAAPEENAAPPMDDDLPPVRKRTSTHATDLKATPDKTPEGYQEKVYSRPVPEGPQVQPAPSPPVPAKPPPPPAPAPTKKKSKKKLPAAAPTTAGGAARRRAPARRPPPAPSGWAPAGAPARPPR
jgi:hypothetical protein